MGTDAHTQNHLGPKGHCQLEGITWHEHVLKTFYDKNGWKYFCYGSIDALKECDIYFYYQNLGHKRRLGWMGSVTRE